MQKKIWKTIRSLQNVLILKASSSMFAVTSASVFPLPLGSASPFPSLSLLCTQTISQTILLPSLGWISELNFFFPFLPLSLSLKVFISYSNRYWIAPGPSSDRSLFQHFFLKNSIYGEFFSTEHFWQWITTDWATSVFRVLLGTTGETTEDKLSTMKLTRPKVITFEWCS